MKWEHSPRLIVDTREQTPLTFRHLESVRGTLQSGDYSVAGLEESFAVERKSVADLVGSLTRGRERFMRELHRLRGFSNAYLLIVGREVELYTLAAQGRANVAQILHSLLAVQSRYGVHVLWVDSADDAALLVESWAFCAYREALKPAGVSLPFPCWVTGALRAIVSKPAYAGIDTMKG
jgi:ERCC4-type nuclease